MIHSRATRRWVLVAGVTALLGGCTSTGHSAPAPVTTSARTVHARPVPPGAPGCRPASPITSGPEIHGTGSGASLYGLIMIGASMPIRADEDVKIVWRMTGSGPVRFAVTDPMGKASALQWGPEPHSGSNYNRPGDEWGVGYRFARAGCWHLHAQRTLGAADVWLRVVPT